MLCTLKNQFYLFSATLRSPPLFVGPMNSSTVTLVGRSRYETDLSQCYRSGCKSNQAAFSCVAVMRQSEVSSEYRSQSLDLLHIVARHKLFHQPARMWPNIVLSDEPTQSERHKSSNYAIKKINGEQAIKSTM